MGRNYNNYYETAVRMVRALQPDLTRDEFLSKVLKYTLEDCAAEGNSHEEQEAIVEHTKLRLAEAWNKSLVPKSSN